VTWKCEHGIGHEHEPPCCCPLPETPVDEAARLRAEIEAAALRRNPDAYLAGQLTPPPAFPDEIDRAEDRYAEQFGWHREL